MYISIESKGEVTVCVAIEITSDKSAVYPQVLAIERATSAIINDAHVSDGRELTSECEQNSNFNFRGADWVDDYRSLLWSSISHLFQIRT